MLPTSLHLSLEVAFLPLLLSRLLPQEVEETKEEEGEATTLLLLVLLHKLLLLLPFLLYTLRCFHELELAEEIGSY